VETLGADQLPLLKQENTSYAVVVRKLKVNWSDLEIACESNGAEHSYYLDRNYGRLERR